MNILHKFFGVSQSGDSSTDRKTKKSFQKSYYLITDENGKDHFNRDISKFCGKTVRSSDFDSNENFRTFSELIDVLKEGSFSERVFLIHGSPTRKVRSISSYDSKDLNVYFFNKMKIVEEVPWNIVFGPNGNYVERILERGIIFDESHMEKIKENFSISQYYKSQDRDFYKLKRNIVSRTEEGRNNYEKILMSRISFYFSENNEKEIKRSVKKKRTIEKNFPLGFLRKPSKEEVEKYTSIKDIEKIVKSAAMAVLFKDELDNYEYTLLTVEFENLFGRIEQLK